MTWDSGMNYLCLFVCADVENRGSRALILSWNDETCGDL
jgi:hypothetical protein